MLYGGRLVLMNSVLTSLPIIILSFFEVLIRVQKRHDYYRSRLFWKSDEDKAKYLLARCDILCWPKYH